MSGILRWIFGLYFLVIALGMVTEREYFQQYSCLWQPLYLSPDFKIARLELNISISGPMRFLLVIILLAGSSAVEHNHSSSAVIYAHTSFGSYNTTQVIMLVIGIGNGICHLI